MYTEAPQFTAWVAECKKIEQAHQLVRGPLPANPFSYREGGKPQNPVYVEGRRYFTIDSYPCNRCYGSGHYSYNPKDGTTCFECRGSGFKGRTRDVTVYTAEALDKLNAKADAKAAAKKAADDAKAQAAEAAFVATYADLLAAVAKLAAPSAFIADVIAKGRKYGTLSDAQVAAVLKAVDRELTKQAQDAAAGWVGSIGERISITATVAFVTFYEGTFGKVYIHGLRDDAGNVIIHKGKAILVTIIDSYPRQIKKGDKVSFAANVKEHGTRDGVKQTIVTHPSRAEFFE